MASTIILLFLSHISTSKKKLFSVTKYDLKIIKLHDEIKISKN